MGFWETFKDFKPSTRVVLIASFVLGVALLIGFSLTDAGVNVTLGNFDPKPYWLRRYNADWFHGHAYIPNILAGLTGFLIGAPVATVILATFTIQREDRAALEKVNGLTDLAWKQYRDAVHEYCSEDQIETLQKRAKKVQKIHDEIFKAMQSYRTKPARTAGDYQKVKEYLLSQVDRWADALTDLSHRVGLETILRLRWYAIRTDWNTLDQYVRLQRLDRELSWFDRTVDSYLQLRMSSEEHPFTEFMQIHEGPHRGLMGSSMNSAIDDLQGAEKLNNEEFDVLYVHKHEERFPHIVVLDYSESLEKLVRSLRGLREAVEKVESAKWPESSREPVKTS